MADFLDSDFHTFRTEEQLRLAKEVYIGYFFDAGVYPTAYSDAYFSNEASLGDTCDAI